MESSALNLKRRIETIDTVLGTLATQVKKNLKRRIETFSIFLGGWRAPSSVS